MIQPPIEILKSLWTRRPDGRWATTDLKGLSLQPKPGSAEEPGYFIVDGDVELMTTTPSPNFVEMLASFGTVDFLMKQSIVPVVVWIEGEPSIRCIGTPSIISCSGYILTAAHVIIDLYENGYGATKEDKQLRLKEGLQFGVLIPIGMHGVRFFPIEKFWIWGSWKESQIITEKDQFQYLTDVAICKIPNMPNGAAHQPLAISVNPFVPEEDAYALGYAEMKDIPLYYGNGVASIGKTEVELYASIGKIMQMFPLNHFNRDVPTPGPCFDFDAKIPGKMSGAPIFGARGAVIRGVVSRSFSKERHAFGAMLGPATELPLGEPPHQYVTLRTLMEAGNEGIAIVRGIGL